MTENFSLIECVCWHCYVRSHGEDSDWTCPNCGELDDYDNLFEVPGPERSLNEEEAERFMKGIKG